MSSDVPTSDITTTSTNTTTTTTTDVTRRDEMLDFGASVSAAKSDTAEPTSTASTASTASSTASTVESSTSPQPTYHPPPPRTSYRDPPQFSPSIAASATRLRRLSTFAGNGPMPTPSKQQEKEKEQQGQQQDEQQPAKTTSLSSPSPPVKQQLQRPVSMPYPSHYQLQTSSSTPNAHAFAHTEKSANVYGSPPPSLLRSGAGAGAGAGAATTAGGTPPVVNLRRGHTFMSGSGRTSHSSGTNPPIVQLRRGATFYNNSSPPITNSSFSPISSTSTTPTTTGSTSPEFVPIPPTSATRPRLRRGSAGGYGLNSNNTLTVAGTNSTTTTTTPGASPLDANSALYARPPLSGGATFVHMDRPGMDGAGVVGMGDQSSFVGHGPLPRAETMTYGASNRMTSSSLPVSSSTTASSATTSGRHHPTKARPRRRLRERPKSGMYGDSNDTHNKDSDANHADVTSVATDGNIGDTEDEDVRVIDDDDVDDDVDVETLTTVKLVDDDFVDDDDDEVTAIQESCAFCDSIESKMESLEQQLEVLREVVKLCTHNEQELQRERALSSEKSLKRSKTWMGRIPNPFNNAGHSSSASASTRIKLREEVDALRKATDILFQKLEETSPSK